MEVDKILIQEIKSFANKTGAYCIVSNSESGEREYELDPVGHISFVYDKNNDDKPTCILFSMEREQTGGALRRIVLTKVGRHASKAEGDKGNSYLLHGYMGGDEIPVSALVIDLEGNDESLEKVKWAEWNEEQGRFRYSWPESWPDWQEI
jgi:hypothetical protein